MKNFGEKMGRKTFFVGVWLGEGKNLWGLGVFSSGIPKYFLSKIERKLEQSDR